MLNLFTIAEENSPRWETTFCDLAARHAPLAEFAQWVEETARISVNCGWSTMTHLLQGDCLKNHYEIARERAARDGSPAEEHLKASLKDFYQRRVSFDRAFENGESFRYGSLNGGCVGLEKYGPLCLVMGVEKQENLTASACLLPGDSLLLCTTAEGELSEGRARDLIGAFRQRATYVSVHRVEAVSSGQRAGWLRIILNAENRESGCVEVIFVGTITIKDLGLVRLSRSTEAAAWNAVFAAHAPDARISSKATVADLTSFLTAERNHQVNVEVIA